MNEHTVEQEVTTPETPPIADIRRALSRQKTLEQDRACAAWERVTAVKGKKYEGEYGAWARKFPMLILTNGLGQSLAFLRAKNKPHHQQLYDHVSLWVTERIYAVAGGDRLLLERLMGAVPGCESNSDIYRRATTEALAFLNWLKRLAEAHLEKKDTAD